MPVIGEGSGARSISDIDLQIGAACLTLIDTCGPSTDERAKSIVAELGPARYSFARSLDETVQGQPLGHMIFMRLVAETLCASDGWQHASALAPMDAEAGC